MNIVEVSSKLPVGELARTPIFMNSPSPSIYLVETSKSFPYGVHSNVTNAMILCHGRLRNVRDYFETGMKLIEELNPEKWIVIAPQFLDVVDLEMNNLTSQYLAWNGDWQSGAPSTIGGSVSSYSVMDDIILKLNNKQSFPHLDHIVVVGHGGGAQFLNRYVIASAVKDISIHYVIANPASYVFFGRARPIPISVVECPSLIDWKYGTGNLPPYCQLVDEKSLFQQFAEKEIILLLGDKDRKTDGILDNSCPARAQGKNRFERGKNFVHNIQHMSREYEIPCHLFAHQIIQGIGHNEVGMFTSQIGKAAIFKNYSNPNPVPSL